MCHLVNEDVCKLVKLIDSVSYLDKEENQKHHDQTKASIFKADYKAVEIEEILIFDIKDNGLLVVFTSDSHQLTAHLNGKGRSNFELHKLNVPRLHFICR